MPLLDLLTSPWIVAPISGALGTAATVAGNVLINRIRASASIAVARERSEADVQAAMSASVTGIIKHYTDALAQQVHEVRELRSEIIGLRERIDAQNAEIAGLRELVATQNSEIAGLNDHIEALSAELKRHGIDPPARGDVPVNA